MYTHLIHFASSDVVVLCQREVNEALVVAKVQVGLMSSTLVAAPQ